MIAKEASLQKRGKEASNREEVIFELRKLAQLNEEAERLLHTIELDIPMITHFPNDASIDFIKQYNKLVKSSNLPEEEREKLLMEEK